MSQQSFYSGSNLRVSVAAGTCSPLPLVWLKFRRPYRQASIPTLQKSDLLGLCRPCAKEQVGILRLELPRKEQGNLVDTKETFNRVRRRQKWAA